MSLVSKSPSLETLKARAQMLGAVRSFFAQRHVLEVDTPILSQTAPIDTHIDVMTLHLENGTKGYLHTSSEYRMKRLLVDYPIDIYQLSHVFREGETGLLHNPEFTMIEWYRVGFSLQELALETLELTQLFVGRLEPIFLSYRDLFLKYTGIDPFQTETPELHQKGLDLGLSLPSSAADWDVDTWLHFYMSFYLEPRLNGLHVIQGFPASQAALARLRQEGNLCVADRFEIFLNGIELANGFHELTDPAEQRRRFEKANEKRKGLGKPMLPLDERFLSALQQGMPDCCGVAAGFDRLFMLHQKASSLQEVVPFTWEQV